MVREVAKHLNANWGAVELYRDDIEELAKLVAALPGTVGVSYSTDKYEFDSLDEIIAKQPTSQELKLYRVETHKNFQAEDVQCRNSSVTVRITPTYSYFEFLNADVVVEGMMTIIDQLMRRHERRFQYHRWPCLPMILVPVLGTLIAYGVAIQLLGVTWGILVVGALAQLLVTFLIMPLFDQKSVINFDYRRNRPSWLVRNKDAIIVAIIGGLFVVVLSLLIDRYILLP